MLKINVPAGIGDISWTYSKLADLNEQLDVRISDDGYHRALDFVKLLPNVIKVEYANFNFHDVYSNPIPRTTTKNQFIEQATKDFVNLSPNIFLERGIRLEEYVPELPTNFHYNINTPKDSKTIAQQVTTLAPVRIGIYCSTYANISAWKGWHLTDWTELINQFNKYMPQTIFVLFGADYDKPFIDDLISMNQGMKCINLAGRTSVSELIEVLKTLHYLVSFPCGIPVLANVLNIPCYMFYPEHLAKLPNTWPDPESILNLSYTGTLFPKPSEVMKHIREVYRLKPKIKGA